MNSSESISTASRSSSSSSQRGGKGVPAGRRVIVLDDDPGLARILALRLRTSGILALDFTDPQQVLEQIQPHDILVTDFQMPAMTGLEVAQRAFEKGWRGPLLIMSGRSDFSAEELIHPLLHRSLTKPFSTRELLEVLPCSS